MSTEDTGIKINFWPDIFRPIGPGDDVVVSMEKLEAYIADQCREAASEARIDELRRILVDQILFRTKGVLTPGQKSFKKRIEHRLELLKHNNERTS